MITLCLSLVLATPFVLRALGIFGPNAEKLYSGATDLAAGAAVEDALMDAGIEGARAVVIPIQGSDGKIAVITVEQGVSTNGNPEEAFGRALLGLTAANQAGHGIERVTIDMRDENGDPGLAITAGQDAVEAFPVARYPGASFLEQWKWISQR